MYDAFMWFGLGVVFGLLCYLLAVIHSENKKRKENEFVWKVRDEVLKSSCFEEIKRKVDACEDKHKNIDNRIRGVYSGIIYELDCLKEEVYSKGDKLYESQNTN